ncbi:MAG TPA: crotonase/enoyl-CoA hydratase family protein [Syntrophorhabdales bacterium]|nr:crotonase/enoyl-CoA hydratase family protein [Syntrophorhabdales bacterium]
MGGKTQRILYEVTDHIAVITFNRPDQRNAFDAETTQEMRAVMDRFEAEEDVWVGIVTGAGERAFCAGMDLKAFAAGDGPAILNGRGGFAGFVTYPRTKPIIAAVNGAALAGGCEIVLSCDLAVAAESAVFGQPEVKRGLYAGAGGAFRLPRAMPKVRAMEMLLTGEPIDAHAAYLLGFVNAVVPREGLMQAAMDLARRICVNAPLGVRANLELARVALDMTDEELWQKNADIWQGIIRSADAAEGPAAFAEKREPRWKAH